MTATPPLWITGLPRPDSWRSLRQAGYPQLLRPLGDKERSSNSGQITRYINRTTSRVTYTTAQNLRKLAKIIPMPVPAVAN